MRFGALRDGKNQSLLKNGLDIVIHRVWPKISFSVVLGYMGNQ